jgi:hypothetical protein
MRTVLAVACVLATIAFTRTTYARDAFEGTWHITVTPDEDAAKNHAKEFKDTLVFKGSQLKSDYFSKMGMQPAAYDEDTRAGITATYKCEMQNEKKKTKALWTGQAGASELSGELTVTKEDGTELKYTYKGERQQ